VIMTIDRIIIIDGVIIIIIDGSSSSYHWIGVRTLPVPTVVMVWNQEPEGGLVGSLQP